MKAARIYSYGSSDAVRLEDAPLPKIGSTQVLVRIRAASVNPVDWKIREGQYAERGEQRFPFTLGQDFAGTVEQLGSSVQGFQQGNDVFGMVWGSYAEFAAIEAKDLVLKPRKLDFAQAASVPLAGLTAFQAVNEIARVGKGQTVLIHGAGGGVGSFLVQFAKLAGAKVIATASPESSDFVRRLGADQIIHYKTERFEERARGVDVVMDLIGGETQDRSWEVLKKGGLLVNFIHQVNERRAKDAGVRTALVQMRYDTKQLSEIAKLIDQGQVQTHVAQVLPLDRVKEALDLNERGSSHGKIVLRVA